MSPRRTPWIVASSWEALPSARWPRPRRAGPPQTVKTKPGPQDVLLVVDVQNGFMPGGALPVAGGDQIDVPAA